MRKACGTSVFKYLSDIDSLLLDADVNQRLTVESVPELCSNIFLLASSTKTLKHSFWSLQQSQHNSKERRQGGGNQNAITMVSAGTIFGMQDEKKMKDQCHTKYLIIWGI